MGLFDEVLSMMGSGGAQQAQGTSGLSAIINYVNSPQVGGIAGLQKMFQQGGLGAIFSSWVSTGQNLPISAEQLQNVLHSGALQEAAQKAGFNPDQLSGMMSSLLPHLVDKLSPNGTLPEAGSLQAMLKGLAAGQSS
ncbi:MAG TPA: YidB family protein [Candidatus Eisenbacteria bacterium]|nr:YidB family protein [Candidatus Eisenbacteria bacterium]